MIGKKTTIRLEHGSGGALSRELIESVIFPRLKSSFYTSLADATDFSAEPLMAYTTDSFVVDPPFFPGSNIGTLSVFGTCNDLAVSGGRALYLTLALIIEDGFGIADLEKIIDSISSAVGEAGVHILSGDTKVVPAGKGGGIFINTSGIGKKVFTESLGGDRMVVGDRVIVSAPIGSHGLSVLAAREGLKVADSLLSDCRFLYPGCSALFGLQARLRFLRDATRGGVSAVLNEAVAGRSIGIVVDEGALPVEEEVAVPARLLGLSPLEIANEGVFLAVVSPNSVEESLSALQNAGSPQAAVVGEVVEESPGKVILRTRVGGRRILDVPRGLLLPRIC